MTFSTIGHNVCTKERKASHPVNFIYITDKPGKGCVTPRAVRTCSTLVDIIMAFIAFSPGISENQTFVALSAAYFIMLTFKREPCRVVVKGIYICVQMPALRTVALTASNLKRGAVG